MQHKSPLRGSYVFAEARRDYLRFEVLVTFFAFLTVFLTVFLATFRAFFAFAIMCYVRMIFASATTLTRFIVRPVR